MFLICVKNIWDITVIVNNPNMRKKLNESFIHENSCTSLQLIGSLLHLYKVEAGSVSALTGL